MGMLGGGSFRGYLGRSKNPRSGFVHWWIYICTRTRLSCFCTTLAATEIYFE